MSHEGSTKRDLKQPQRLKAKEKNPHVTKHINARGKRPKIKEKRPKIKGATEPELTRRTELPTPTKRRTQSRWERKREDSNKQGVTEESGAEPPAAEELRGVQVAWELEPSRQTDSSKTSRALGGLRRNFRVTGDDD